MFQSTMSPKLLNVEKLEKKFASLTRSRESIQGLSTWIIRHKDFYKEIVNQWLNALTRDFNALTMFYVANDVIQNCGRKKAPEFREAFATVLEKAVSLEKVKEIKTEVTRMLTLWHDRSIYDDEFFKKLEEKLNAAAEDSGSEIEEEPSETQVIANFKLENVINSLMKLKTLEDELIEKETFLEDIEEPGMCNIDNLIVKMDSQKELHKFDKFQKLVEDCMSLTEKIVAAKKAAILSLKYSNIFYNAQMEDAKKVAHAYRIYGKKVKILEKALSEKISTLPEETLPSPEIINLSPCTDINSSQESLSVSVASCEDIKSNYEENNLDTSASPSKIAENKENADKKCESVTEEKSPTNCATVIDSEINIDNENKMQNVCYPTENTSKDSSFEVAEILTAPKVVETNSVSSKPTKTEVHALPDEMESDSIDFLLEKAYDDQQIKGSKLRFKRKIDNLLKLKQAKTCKLENEQVSENNVIPSDSKMSAESVVSNNEQPQPVSSDTKTQLSLSSVSDLLILNKLESYKSPSSKEESNILTENIDSDKVCATDTSIDPKSSSISEKNNQISDIATGEQIVSNMENVNNSKQTDNFKEERVIDKPESTQISNNNETKNIPTNSLSFQNLPDIPTELLKNILDKHRINMNLSLKTGPSLNASTSSSNSNEINQPSLNQKNDKVIDENYRSMTENDASLKSSNNYAKNVCQEVDTTSSSNIKNLLTLNHSISDVDNVKNEPKTKSTIFLDNLQNILENFTQEKTLFKELKCSETSSTLASMPFGNTLRVFSSIMQNCNKVNYVKTEPFSSSNLNNNPISALQSMEFLSNKFCSTETKTIHSSDANSLVKGASSVSLDKTIELNENFSMHSKTDNLEIMDMEVDSDDENSE